MPSSRVVDAAFARLADVLDEVALSTWSRAQLEQLIERIIAHYAHTRRHNNSNNTDKEDDESDNDDDDDGDDDEVARRRHAVAAVDRDLVRVRQLLLQLMPPYAASHALCCSSGGAVSQEHQQQQRQQQAHTNAATTAVATPTYDVDAFLYNDDDIDVLVERGALPRHYCRRCGAHDVGDVAWVTHSLTQDEVVYMAAYVLPALARQGLLCSSSSGSSTIVDVGSRLGVVLWSCWSAQRHGLLPHMRRIVGVEVDAVYARLQRDVYAHLAQTSVSSNNGSHDNNNDTAAVEDANDAATTTAAAAATAAAVASVEVLESDCFAGEGAAALCAADVVVLHNVFEYFCNDAVAHVRAWRQLRACVCRRGQLLVCKPSLSSTLMSLGAEALRRGGLLDTPTAATHDDDTGTAKTEAVVRASVTTSAHGKRTRDGHGADAKDDVAQATRTMVQRWLSSYVDEVDVRDVARAFLRDRAPDRDSDDDKVDDDKEDSSSDDGDSSSYDDDKELRKRIAGIHVYRVL